MKNRCNFIFWHRREQCSEAFSSVKSIFSEKNNWLVQGTKFQFYLQFIWFWVFFFIEPIFFEFFKISSFIQKKIWNFMKIIFKKLIKKFPINKTLPEHHQSAASMFWLFYDVQTRRASLHRAENPLDCSLPYVPAIPLGRCFSATHSAKKIGFFFGNFQTFSGISMLKLWILNYFTVSNCFGNFDERGELFFINSDLKNFFY